MLDLRYRVLPPVRVTGIRALARIDRPPHKCLHNSPHNAQIARQEIIESGEYASSAGLSKAQKINKSYLSRILRLALIAPDFIRGDPEWAPTPARLQLYDLLKPRPKTTL